MKKLFFIFSMLLAALCNAQTVTEVIYPKYVQGVGTGNPPDDRKVPFACRMTINGLTPNATYRYYSRFVQDPSLATNGQGFYIIANPTGDFTRITSATLGVPGRYGEFTTNASGSATDWFIVEPSSAIDYQPGTQLYWRILMNNGAGGVSVVNRATAANPVTVLGFGSGSTQGTGLRSTAIPALTAKNFVFLYGNPAGTGRPEAGTFVESDGTDNNAGANGYAPFYGNSVDGVDKAFGTIIPNNLSTGVRNISQYALGSGALVNTNTTTNGVFPTIPSGTVSTVNTNTGLTEVVITNLTFVDPTPICNIVLSSTSTNVSCFGANTGAVNLTVTGAVAPVTYSWSNGATTQDLTGVPAGSYTVTVTDAVCTKTLTAAVSQPATALAASSTQTAIVCGGTSTVVISAAGGTAPYTGTGTFSQPAGSQTYTVTDANGCTDVVTVNVSTPSGPTATSSQTPVACFGGTSTVTISATGGAAPYTGTGTFTQAAGTQSYTVTDANGCTSTTTVTVTQPAALVAASTQTPVVGGTSTVTISVTGGTAPYTGTGTFTQSAGTTQSYTVTDANGCTSTISVTIEGTEPVTFVRITSPANNTTYVALADIPLVAEGTDPDGIRKIQFFNGTTLLATQNFAPYEYTWHNRPAGDYSFTAQLTNKKGVVTTSDVVHVTVVDNMPPSVKITSPANNSNYVAPAAIRLVADAKDEDGTIKKVQFYNGTTLIATQNYFPYALTWYPVAAGEYTITANAIDDKGAVTTSEAIHVSVAARGSLFVNSENTKAGNAKLFSAGSLSLKAGPNPANNTLNLYTTGFKQNEKLTISVVSVSGIVMKTIQRTSNPLMKMDVSSLRSGVYFLKVLSGDKVLYTQFVKL